MYKSSAVAVMGDHFATIDMDRKVGAFVPLSVGRAGPPSTTIWPGAQAYLRIKWYPFGHSMSTLQTNRQDRQTEQRSHSIGLTVLQTVAQKLK